MADTRPAKRPRQQQQQQQQQQTKKKRINLSENTPEKLPPPSPPGGGLVEQPIQPQQQQQIAIYQSPEQRLVYNIYDRILSIQNVAVTIKLNVQFNLMLLAYQLNAKFCTKKLMAVISHNKDPKSTTLIYSTGYMVTTGAVSFYQTLLAIRKQISRIEKLGYTIRPHDYRIRNISSCIHLGFRINLTALHQNFSMFDYNPESFPGLIFSPTECCRYLIFYSGYMVIVGVKSYAEAMSWLLKIYPLLREYRVDGLDLATEKYFEKVFVPFEFKDFLAPGDLPPAQNTEAFHIQTNPGLLYSAPLLPVLEQHPFLQEWLL